MGELLREGLETPGVYYCFCTSQPVQAAMWRHCGRCAVCADERAGPAPPHCAACDDCLHFDEDLGCRGCGAGARFADPRHQGKVGCCRSTPG